MCELLTETKKKKHNLNERGDDPTVTCAVQVQKIIGRLACYIKENFDKHGV